MGKLRKIGRKIKKGVKKLFKSKIGKIVGMVGLYFAMGAAMKGLSNWFSSSFGKAGATAAEGTAVAAEGVATTGATSTGGGTIGSVVEGAATNAEATNAVIAGVDSAAINGTTNASSTITEAVTNVTDSGILDTPVTEVKDSLVLKENVVGSDMLAENKIIPDNTFTVDVPSKDLVVPDDVKFASLTDSGTLFEGGGSGLRGVTDPSLSGPEFSSKVANVATEGVSLTDRSKILSNVGNYFAGPESTVIPDTIAGVGSGLIMSQFQDEPEMGGGFIAPQPIQVQAQGAYLQEVGPMMSTVTGVPNFSNFTQMANQSVYGIGTPNHLAGLYG
jgi:hypothetical protein